MQYALNTKKEQTKKNCKKPHQCMYSRREREKQKKESKKRNKNILKF